MKHCEPSSSNSSNACISCVIPPVFMWLSHPQQPPKPHHIIIIITIKHHHHYQSLLLCERSRVHCLCNNNVPCGCQKPKLNSARAWEHEKKAHMWRGMSRQMSRHRKAATHQNTIIPPKHDDNDDDGKTCAAATAAARMTLFMHPCDV